MVDRCSFSLVSCVAIDLEEGFDLVEKRFFRSIVGRSEVLRALEHQVLEIVGETGSLRRVVLSSYLYRDVGLDAGCLLVYAHVDLQAVVERIDLRSERIVFHSLVLVL